jgi:hypothetical protein
VSANVSARPLEGLACQVIFLHWAADTAWFAAVRLEGLDLAVKLAALTLSIHHRMQQQQVTGLSPSRGLTSRACDLIISQALMS